MDLFFNGLTFQLFSSQLHEQHCSTGEKTQVPFSPSGGCHKARARAPALIARLRAASCASSYLRLSCSMANQAAKRIAQQNEKYVNRMFMTLLATLALTAVLRVGWRWQTFSSGKAALTLANTASMCVCFTRLSLKLMPQVDNVLAAKMCAQAVMSDGIPYRERSAFSWSSHARTVTYSDWQGQTFP